jgi:hypothetical protein
MNRYRFDLESSHDAIRDETGVESDNLDQVIEQAVAEIEEMRIGGDLADIGEGWDLVIRSDAGAELKRIPV